MEMNENPDHPIYKIFTGWAVIYFYASANNNQIDLRKWNWANYWTFDGILRGFFFGNGAPIILKFSREAEPETLISYEAANEFFNGKPKRCEIDQAEDLIKFVDRPWVNLRRKDEVHSMNNLSYPQLNWSKDENQNFSSFNVTNFLQSSLQLLELITRKKTTERPQNVTTKIDFLNESEANLKTGTKRWSKFNK